jgi:hypothetical protein
MNPPQVSNVYLSYSSLRISLCQEEQVQFYSYLRIGLDASTARNVIQCLSDLSKQGRELTYFDIIMFSFLLQLMDL